VERKIVEPEISNRPHRFSHDAAPPKLLAQPVTHCCCVPMHVLAWVNTDAAGSYFLDFNAKSCGWLF
jgi:hypothetical protein